MDKRKQPKPQYGRFRLKTEEVEPIAEEILNYIKTCGQFWEIWDEMLPQAQDRMKSEIIKIIKSRCNQAFRKGYYERRYGVKTE